MRVPFVSCDERITVPDDSLSIKDILYRFSRGLPLDNVVRPPIYDEDEDEDDFEVSIGNEHLEFSEVASAYQESSEIINNYNELLKLNNNDNPTASKAADTGADTTSSES